MTRPNIRLLGAVALIGLPLTSGAAAADVHIMGFAGIFADNYQQAVIEPFMEQTGIQVHYHPIQLSAQNLGMLRAERNNPSIDISLMDAMVARTGNAEGIFAEIDPARLPVLSELYEEAHINDNFGPAVTFDNTVMLYNTDLVDEPPSALADLWREEFSGRIAMFSAPEISALMNMIVLTRSLGGDETVSVEPAIERLAELSPHVQTWQPNPDTYTLVINGTAHVGAAWNARAQFFSDDSDGKLGIVIPEEGTMLQINTINLVANAPNEDEAMEFMNYALSAEAQTAFTNQMFYAPVNTNATPSEEALARTVSSPETRAKIQPLDWSFFNENRENWLQDWRRHILSAR